MEVGLDFVHENGMSGKLYFVEMMGGGGAVFDYDNDGDLDLYLVQGHFLDPAWPGPDDSTPRDRLYRNDLKMATDGTRKLHFTDVTKTSGLKATGYGMGVTTGDYNNDGWVDLYVLNWGDNQLWRNNGDGTFTDITVQSGSNDPNWSTAAAFLDFDLDGWLDLLIVNYVDYSFENDHPCYSPISGGRDYCHPSSYPPAPDRLLRNRRDGTFENITFQTRIATAYGSGLGTTVADFNGDGWFDMYVANDGMENQLWLNQDGRYFQNHAIISGTAVNSAGATEASMGVNAADFDGDGDVDLFMTHLTRETNTLYINHGLALFQDQTRISGVGAASLPYTGFGTVDFDYDNDGWLDLFIANGHVGIIQEQAQRGDPFPLKQVNQLLRNLGEGRFRMISATDDSVFGLEEVSRGAAMGDLDNDGDSDILLVNNNGPARLLRNEVGHKQAWLGVRLVGKEFQRDMLGSRIALVRTDGSTLWRRVRVDGSYCSAHDPRVLFGLGGSNSYEAVRVYWPGGLVEEWRGLGTGQYHTLIQGSGKRVE
ncbi:CRTAC1 family protein [candidate division KSB1 bacterium]|nr:CRTAC1 family protein [candidate division KSB1 bacterium]NIR72448.1 CRTAC1 family protein [candidate division KSB1 bacterium]NIS25087.1 CRTAC1 family protein [candidate division KSB1 bacterium]NIT72006.1 CRTAC1 family protein [candidate division KSB1 bacterium]NIU25786.1 CRTAC1 family protein [candidate division KSB1 bacterium]